MTTTTATIDAPLLTKRDAPAINVTALKKTYAGTVNAVRGIDISVARGEIEPAYLAVAPIPYFRFADQPWISLEEVPLRLVPKTLFVLKVHKFRRRVRRRL